MFEEILTAIPFGIILSFTIGPVFFVLLETSITKGVRSALMFDAGVILADIIFISIAYFSTNTLMEKIKDNPNFLIFGGILLIIYGAVSYVQVAQSYGKIVRDFNRLKSEIDYGKLFLKGFLLNFINIGVLAGWLGFLVIANSVATTKNGVIVFIVTMLISYFVVDVLKIVLAKRLKSKFTPRIVFKTKKTVALIILFFGFVLLFQGLFPSAYKKNKARIEKIYNPVNHQQN